MDGLLFQISFWVMAVVLVGSALLVVTLKNLARATVFLVFFFLGAAGVYFLLHAEFLALVQVMVYAGAVAVLFAFVIMLTPDLPGTGLNQSKNRLTSMVLAVLFVIMMVIAFSRMTIDGAVPGTAGLTLADLGQALLGKYLLPFELVSVVLLVALIGAVLYTALGKGEGDHSPD